MDDMLRVEIQIPTI